MDTESEWGRYVPPNKSWYLRLLISMGFARGFVRKKILYRWRQSFGNFVDFENSGIKFRLNLGDNVTDGRILTSFNSYDRTELKYLKSSCIDGVFVDIGANVGFYSLSLARSVARVIAIEPNPTTFSRLKYNISLNDFTNKLTILPIGIGIKGEFNLVSSGDLGSASIRPNASGAQTAKVSIVPLLDTLFEQKIEKLHGVKIDIEGMEDRALMPFFKKAPSSLWPNCVVIEHCNRVHWEEDVIDYMLQSGYRIVHENKSNLVLIRK